MSNVAAPDLDQGIAFASLVVDAKKLTTLDFATKHGASFFLLVTSRPPQPPNLQRTVDRLDIDKVGDKPTGETHILVLPLRRKPTNSSPLLRIGRGASCDIVIADDTISKLHAFVQGERGDPPGRGITLFDAGSFNGTFVGEEPVPARGTGEPTALTPGATVRFGNVTTTFLDAARLQSLARDRPK